jgi:uncharacterized protein
MSTKESQIDVDILKDVLSNLVTDPSHIEIHREIDEQGVLLSIRVNKNDMGIVIGRDGNMVNSLKIIMRGIGKAHGMNIRIRVLEADGSVYKGKAEENADTPSEPSDQEPQSVGAATSTLDEDLIDFTIN